MGGLIQRPLQRAHPVHDVARSVRATAKGGDLLCAQLISRDADLGQVIGIYRSVQGLQRTLDMLDLVVSCEEITRGVLQL
jgi:hypothetical protein